MAVLEYSTNIIFYDRSSSHITSLNLLHNFFGTDGSKAVPSYR